MVSSTGVEDVRPVTAVWILVARPAVSYVVVVVRVTDPLVSLTTAGAR